MSTNVYGMGKLGQTINLFRVFDQGLGATPLKLCDTYKKTHLS